MNEITNVTVSYTLPKIAYDLTEVKKQVNEITTKYKGLIIEEDDIQDMKKDIAKLNTLSKEIDSKRKNVIKEIKKPLKSFEDELKSIVADLNSAYRNVKDQIDTFTEEQKKARKEEIMAFDEWKNHLTFDDRWLGKSRSDKSIKNDMEQLLAAYEKNLKTIETTCKMVGIEKGKYVELLQNQIAVNDIIDLIQNDKEVLENAKKDIKIEPVFKEDLESEKHVETYFITATKQQHDLLEKYMASNNIEYQINEEELF